MKAGPARWAIVAAFVLVTLPIVGGSAAAQEPGQTLITGRVEHGLPQPSFDPTELTVILNVFEGITAFDPERVTPAADGSFSFTVALAPTRTYFLGVEYQGAVYSATREANNIDDPVVLQVFEATHDPTVLTIASYSVIVTGADRNDQWVEILERASVRNDSGTTLVPDLTQSGPAMLSFLRFALPSGAYNLDVRSTLVGGDVLEVDRGFAVTTPIPPTGADDHVFEFVYRLDYGDGLLDLSRTMRFGARELRFVVPDDVAFPVAPQLQDLGTADLNSRLLRLLEGSGVQPGDVVALGVTDLPVPTVWTRFWRVASDRYVSVVVPALVAIAFAGLTAYAFVRRRRVAVDLRRDADLDAQRTSLLRRVAELEERRRAGKVSERHYAIEREDLKEALVALSVRAHIGDDENPR